MAFPTNPAEGQRYNEYIYTNNLWKKISLIETPRFQAYGAVSGVSDNDWIFNHVTINIGGCYSTTTGKFTAPFNGDYIFNWSNIGNIPNSVYRYFLRKNGVDVGNVHFRVDTSSTISDYGENGTMLWMLSLLKGDTVNIYFKSDSNDESYVGQEYPLFSGHFVK